MHASLETYQQSLPWRGFGSDDLKTGVRLLETIELAKRAYVQHNAKHSVKWLAYDVDRASAASDWLDSWTAPPNILVVNRDNGHAHLLYGLETPVHDYAGASEAALRYLAAVDIALTRQLDADPGYAKLLSKNPLRSDRWAVVIVREALYTLDRLAIYVDPTALDRRRKVEPIALGRNCALFEDLRRWAYRERRKEQQYLSEDMFHGAVRDRAQAINAGFTPPLPHAEVRHIAKSVARWTWRRMSREGFLQWSRRRWSKALDSIKARARDRHDGIRQTARECPELTQADIAALHDVDQATVSRALRVYANTISDKHSSGGPRW